MLFVSQEKRRVSDTVLFMITSENNDIANQSVDTSFFTMINHQLASLARRDYFYVDVWRVNLGMYIIMYFMHNPRYYIFLAEPAGKARQRSSIAKEIW